MNVKCICTDNILKWVDVKQKQVLLSELYPIVTNKFKKNDSEDIQEGNETSVGWTIPLRGL